MNYVRLSLLSALAAALIASACDDPAAPGGARCASPTPLEAVVTFSWDTRPEDRMRVLITHAPTVAAACAYLASGTGPHIPTGTIVRGPGSDDALPFHYIAESVRLAEAAIEICDGRLMKTVAALDDYIEGVTGDRNALEAPYCPWGARPVSVE